MRAHTKARSHVWGLKPVACCLLFCATAWPAAKERTTSTAPAIGIEKMPPGVFIECEDFECGKDWTVQNSKVTGFSGRAYVVDKTPGRIAGTVVSKDLSLPRPGKYNVWIRAYLGSSKTKYKQLDRSLAVSVNGRVLATTHRARVGGRFTWELAGAIDVRNEGKVRVLIHDRGKMWAMPDCLLLTDDLEWRPKSWTGNSKRACLPGKPFVLDEAPRQHVEEIAAGRHTYTVNMGGTLDEFNTPSYRETYSKCMWQTAKFQPNRYVVIENVGDNDVAGPRIVINGRRNWFSADELLAGILEPDMSDAEKAMAIWAFLARHDVQAHDNNRRVGPPFPATGSEYVNRETTNPSANTFKERANPIKAVNCYYCSGCSLSAANFVVLCRHAGLIARAVWMSALDTYKTHCLGEAWYDGDWHLFDPERRAIFLDADNVNLASYKTLHEHPELEARTLNSGFASKVMGPHAKDYERYYPPHIMPVEQWLSTIDVTLRPDERLIYRWANDGKYRYGANPRGRSHLPPYHLANGKLIYRPELKGEAFQRGLASIHNIERTSHGGRTVLRPHVVRAPGDGDEPIIAPPAWVTYKITSPYPIVGALVGGTFYRRTPEDACRIRISVRDSEWVEVWSAKETGSIEQYITIDDVLDPLPNPAIYSYYVKFELQARSSPADARVAALYIESDLQMAATALPSLSVGRNEVVYRDATGSKGRVRITHGWEESTATRPPLAPAGPMVPANGGTVALASFDKLTWQPASDPDGKPIADYHVRVSPRNDMLIPVSPNLNRITHSDQPTWEMPKGWLVKGRTYYWRVRAQDAWGAWSGWSPVWSFRVRD